MSISIVRARSEHAPAIVENLSDFAAQEIEDFGRAKDDIEREIEASLYASAGLYNGRVAVVWGVRVGNLLDRTGFVWALTTRLVDDHPFLFARYSKIAIDQMMGDFDALHGLVRPEFKRSIRWLRFLGFEILPHKELFGRNYNPFIRRA